MKRPKISVIVPLYNCEPWIERVGHSLAEQTEGDFECLLIDDAGPNREGIAKAETLVRRDRRFRLLRHVRNLGMGAARNTGIDNATGEWLAFLDQDDLYFPEAFQSLLEAAQRTGADVVEGLVERADGAAPLPEVSLRTKKEPLTIFEGENLARHVATLYLPSQGGVNLWNRLYRRSWWGDKRLDPSIPGTDDAVFCAQHLWRANSLVRIPAYVYRFSITPGSQSSTLSLRWTRLMCQSFEAVWNAYKDGLLRTYPELSESAKAALQWVLVRWIIYKCWHRRSDYSPEERRQIAEAIRHAKQTIDIRLPLKAALRLRFFDLFS